VDTIGAGDTFNAAVICALLSGAGAEGAIMFGCAVAGVKVGHMGLGGVVAAGQSVLAKIAAKAVRI